jgi:hypothetical protein
MTTRYYLNPDGSLRPVEEPGRCNAYWEAYRKGDLSRADLHLSLDSDGEVICPTCYDWLERCDEISRISHSDFALDLFVASKTETLPVQPGFIITRIANRPL